MRYIQKKAEPESLKKYRRKENAYFDGYKEKEDVRENLLKEQGYLCGYCMRRIQGCSETKIEHVVPQSTLRDNEKETLNYKIMLGVCYGNEAKGRKFKNFTCDAHKRNTDLKVNPFDKNCIAKIKYTSNGMIDSEDEDVKHDLVDTLNLNCDEADVYLVKNRREVLNACKDKLKRMQKSGIWSRSILEKMFKEYKEPDKDGKLKPYSGIVMWYLEKRLQ